MKNSFIIFCLFLASLAVAQEPPLPTPSVSKEPLRSLKLDFLLHGDADFFLEMAHLPTSEQGQSRFDFSLLQLSPTLVLNPDLALHFRFVLADERSSKLKNYMNEVQDAYIEYQDPREKKLRHDFGLIRNAWLTTEGFAGEMDFFGVTGRSLVRRYQLMGEGDLGYQALYQPSENGLWALGFVNGEENKSDEKGPNKETYLMGLYQFCDFRIQSWLSYGRVDRLDSSINERLQLLLRIEKTWGRFQVGLEGLSTQDPSVDLESEGRLQGITFTELATPRQIWTRGGRMEVAYRLNESQDLMVRYDYLVPQWESKRVVSFETSWIKKESDLMRWGLFYEDTLLGSQHSSQSKRQEWVRIGLGIGF